MDVLSDVLETIRLQSQILGRIELRGPFGLSLDRRPFSVFHLILKGQAVAKELEQKLRDMARV